jgi:hypothetical protein
VLDETGGGVPAATVMLSRPGERRGVTRMTDGHGIVVFSERVAGGVCDVTARLLGFEITVAERVACSEACDLSIEMIMRADARNTVVVY